LGGSDPIGIQGIVEAIYSPTRQIVEGIDSSRGPLTNQHVAVPVLLIKNVKGFPGDSQAKKKHHHHYA
jgi:hypothetical protein